MDNNQNEINQKFLSINEDVENLQKPISTQALKHFGVMDQLINSRNDFINELIHDTKEKKLLTYLNDDYKSYFLPTYKRCVNFALEEKEQYFKNKPEFGNVETLEIMKNYDYLNKMVLCIQLPDLTIKEKYKTEIINIILKDLGINYIIDDLTYYNKKIICQQINLKLKIKYYEMTNKLKLLNQFSIFLKSFSVHNDLNNSENFVLFLLWFVLNNSLYLNIDENILNIVVYLLNCLSFYKLNDYVIDTLYDFETFNVENIIKSVKNKNFKDDLKNNKNCFYLLNELNQLIELVNGKFKILDIKTNFKIQVNPKYLNKNENSKYIIHESKLYTYEKFKNQLFINLFKSPSFNEFLERYEKQILNIQYDNINNFKNLADGIEKELSEFYIYYIYFQLQNKYKNNIKVIESLDSFLSILTSSSIIKNYTKREIKYFDFNKQIDEFLLSINYIYGVLNYFVDNLYDLNDDLVKNNNGIISTLTMFINKTIGDFSLFVLVKQNFEQNEFKKAKKMLFDSFSIFNNYFFYDLIKYLKFDDYTNNKTKFKTLLNQILNIWNRYIEIDKTNIYNAFNSELVYDYSDIENQILKSTFNINKINKIKENLILSLNNNNKQKTNFHINQIFNLEVGELKNMVRFVETYEQNLTNSSLFDLSTTQSAKNSLFNICKNVLKFIFPFLNDYLNIVVDENITVKQYIKNILNSEIEKLEDLFKKYNQLFEDLKNGDIQDYEYYINFKYKKNVGLELFDYTEITCDNQVLVKTGNEFYKIYNSLHQKAEHINGLNKMYNGVNGIIYIPLHFFFNEYFELSLPLLCLKNSNLNFNVKFKNFYQLLDNPLVNEKMIKPELFEKFDFKTYMLMKYAIIEKGVAKNIITKPQKMLIHQFQYSGSYYINEQNQTALLNLKNPIKYIAIYVEDLNFNPFETMQIYFNGYQITNKIDFDYYRLCTKLNTFNACYDDNVYIINYSLYPEDLQPSGSCNYSMFNKTELKFKLKDDIKVKNIKIMVFALAYNYFNIVDGKGIIEFES